MRQCDSVCAAAIRNYSSVTITNNPNHLYLLDIPPSPLGGHRPPGQTLCGISTRRFIFTRAPPEDPIHQAFPNKSTKDAHLQAKVREDETQALGFG